MTHGFKEGDRVREGRDTGTVDEVWADGRTVTVVWDKSGCSSDITAERLQMLAVPQARTLFCPKGCTNAIRALQTAGLYKCSGCGFTAVRSSFDKEKDEPPLHWPEAAPLPAWRDRIDMEG